MPSEYLMKIIYELEDRASDAAKKADDMIKRFGDSASQSNNKAAQSAEKFNQKLVLSNSKISETARNARKIGNEGQESFNKLNKSQQDAVVKFNMLDKSTQNVLHHLNGFGMTAISNFPTAIEAARNKLQALDNVTHTWSGSLEYSRTKLQLLGVDTDSLKGKIQVVGTAIQTHLGSKWDTVKTKIGEVASNIKTRLTSALSSVRSKIESLGDAFSGLGGIISSVFGAIGVNSVQEMTVGLSIGRQRIQSLTESLLGTDRAAKDLWNKWDNLTSQGLVSLDELAQAMNTIRMSTGMSTQQLSGMTDVVNDIGQRAILMGKSGSEAVGLMQAAGKGLNGEFEMLRDNFGITKEALIDLGWDGSAEDVEGYTKALEAYLAKSGDLDGVLDTTSGKLTVLQKNYRIAGRTIGDMFIPYIDMALDKLIEMTDPNTGNGLAQLTLYVAGLSSVFMTLAPTITPTLQAMDLLVGKGKAVLQFFGLMKAEEDALTFAKVRSTAAEKARSAVTAISGAAHKAYAVIIGILRGEEDAWTLAKVRSTAAEKARNAVTAISGAAHKAYAVIIGLVRGEEEALTMATSRGIIADKAAAAVKYLAGVATATYSAIVGLLTGEIGLVTAATMIWNAVLEANPIMIVVLAIIALVAVIYEVGKAFGWWSNIQEMLSAIWNAIQNLWNAFINHPDVQAIIQGITNAWNWLCGAIGNVIEFIGSFFGVANSGEFDIFKAIIDALTIAWQVLTTPIRLVITVLQILYPYLEQFFQSVLVPLGEFLVTVFTPVWDLLVSIFTTVINTVMGLISAFQQFFSGQITLPQLLSSIWDLICQMFTTVLTTIANFVINWAGQLLSSALTAGANFLNGISTYIQQLPGKIWNWLVQTSMKIVMAGVQWVNTVRSKASELVNAAVSFVSQLPGKIYNEFAKIPGRIRDAIMGAINAAKEFGQQIINAVLGALGIHSPGIVQNAISDEFSNTVEKIKDTIKPAGEYAKQVGEEIVDKFGDPKLSLDTEELMHYMDLDANPLENIDMASLDLSSVSGGLDSAMGLTDDTNTMIGESYNQLALMMMNTLNNMVLQDQLAYSTIQSNDLATFQAISTGLNLNLVSMSMNLRTQLAQMLATHRNAMNNATNTTRQQLSLMLNETMKVTGEMRSAWAVMADSIINAAARIKNEATTYFNQLSSTIGTFYRKLQNPSQWAGGDSTGSPSTVRRVGRDPSVMTRITRGVANSLRRENQLPYTITAVKAADTGLVNPAILEYMNASSSSRLDVLDLLQRGVCPNCFAGGWADVVNPNVSHIKNTAREWKMKGPAIHTGVGDIDTGLSFQVKDFENGKPHISWESFVRIATAVASAIPYDFYYNSDKYGSWQNALAHGAWNCYDGASAMVALANACGYGGSVFCGGSWNGVGHCWAHINGHTFDTTALRNRGGWTAGPCNYSLPGPSAGGINIKIPNRGGIAPRSHTNPLEGLFDNNETAANSEEVKLTLEHNVNVTVDGETENIDTNALIDELTASVTDKNIINRIADALIKRDKRIARMGGA